MGYVRSYTADFRSLGQVIAKAARGKKVVAFDVFDTLLRRRVEPETIKDLVARELAERLARRGCPADWEALRQRRRTLEHELGQESEAHGHDHEFRIEEMARRWVEQSVGRPEDELADALVGGEIELEKQAALPTPGIADTLAALRRGKDRRLVFVTDIYLGLDVVWDLLRGCSLAEFFAAGYCSSTDLLTKRAGGLYRDVLQREGLQPAALLFVGDNPHSDVDTPRRLGIETVHIRDDRELKRRTRLQVLDQLARRNPFWIGALVRETVESCPAHIQDDGSPHYGLGLTLAPAFIAFTLHVIEQARRLKLDRLFFLSREGYTFMRMYRRLVRRLGLSGTLPAATYLAVSRASTFLPSMEGLDLDELNRMWHQYDRQSINRLLRNLNLPHEEFCPLAARCGFKDLDAPIEDPRSDAAFQAFLADADVQRGFGARRDQARNLLMAYLEQKGFYGIRRAGIVDIGWKGTIQDNLVRAAAHHEGLPEVHGLYFGLIRMGSAADPLSHKHGFMADSERDDYGEQVIFRNGPAFEMFSSAPHGAVEEYRRTGPAGTLVKPIVRLADSEQRNLRTHFATVLRGVEHYFRQYLAVAPLVPATSDQMKPYVLDQLRRYILYPTYAEARSFLAYSHVENFGVHQVSTYEFKGSWRDILLGGSVLGIPRRLIQSLERQFWPQAVLKRTGIGGLNFAFDLLETRFATRG